MSRINPMLLIDFYKAVHAEMLPKDITKSVSYFGLIFNNSSKNSAFVIIGNYS